MHKQGWSKVQHSVKHNCIWDIPTWAQKHFVKMLSVNAARLQMKFYTASQFFWDWGFKYWPHPCFSWCPWWSVCSEIQPWICSQPQSLYRHRQQRKEKQTGRDLFFFLKITQTEMPIGRVCLGHVWQSKRNLPALSDYCLLVEHSRLTAGHVHLTPTQHHRTVSYTSGLQWYTTQTRTSISVTDSLTTQ